MLVEEIFGNSVNVGCSSMAVDILDSDALIAVCVDSCRDDLTALRSKIQSACQGSDDFIIFQNTAYPGKLRKEK